MRTSATIALFALILALLWPERLAGATRYSSIRTTQEVEINLQTLFDSYPASGYMPMRMSIRNRTTSTHTWTLEARVSLGYGSGNGMETTQRFEVEAGAAKTWDFLIGIPPTDDGYFSQVIIDGFVSGHGVRSGSFSDSEHYGSHGRDLRFVGLSSNLHRNLWGIVSDRSFWGSSGVGGTTLEDTRMTGDWRGYLCLDGIFFAEEDWLRLDAAFREAILKRTAAGGQLFFLIDAPTLDPATKARELDLPADFRATERRGPYGFGTIGFIEAHNWDGTMRNAAGDSIRKAMQGFSNETLRSRLITNFRSGWEFNEVISAREVGSVFIILFITAFGVLVGPVNLLVFSRGSKRYRLFWTTPLISVTTSVLLVIFIFFKDGTGGTGARARVDFYLPEMNQVISMQNEISRTGMLTNRSFTLSESAHIDKVVLTNSLRDEQNTFRREGNRYYGDFFRNRSRQAFVTMDVQPTRSRLEVVGYEGTGNNRRPIVQSSFNALLNNLHYTDANGNTFYADSLGQGQRLTLEPIDSTALPKAANTYLSRQPDLNELVTPSVDRANAFFAIAIAESDDLDTLPSITWKVDNRYVAGYAAIAEGGAQ